MEAMGSPAGVGAAAIVDTLLEASELILKQTKWDQYGAGTLRPGEGGA
jgi:hypothetical protein